MRSVKIGLPPQCYVVFFFKVIETLAIDKWNTDSVEEFLDIYLEHSIQDETEVKP